MKSKYRSCSSYTPHLDVSDLCCLSAICDYQGALPALSHTLSSAAMLSRLYELSRMPLTFAMTETLSGQSLYFTRTRQPSRTQTCSPLELMGAESEFVFFMYFAPFLIGCSAVFATRPGGEGIQRAAAGAAVIAPRCRLPYTAGLPPSPRERVSKYLYPLRFHCEAACQSRFWGRVHRSSSRRHRAAPHVADRLRSRRFCARCTVYSVVGNSQKCPFAI